MHVKLFTLGAALWLATVPVYAQGPGDPLDPVYLPAMDTNPAHYPANIWVTDSLAKVLQESGTPGPNHWFIGYTTKNEFQSFQVHIRAGATPIGALNVKMSDLVNARTGTHISAASTDIVVYREAYENINIPTATTATYLNTLGHTPDILIPAVDPYYHQTTKAFPFTVAAGNNQSVWIDVHTPAAAPSGYYSGTVTVNDGNTVLATMPVVYAVWNWQMPSTASLPSTTTVSYGGFCLQVYGPAGCAVYPGAAGFADYGVTLANVDAAVQMLDNRYSLSGLANIFPGGGSFSPAGGASFDLVYGPLLSGTPAHVSSILPGARLTSWQLSALPGQFNAATFQNFQSHFQANGWVTPFYPLVDEPDPNDFWVWGNLIANGNAAHSYSTPPLPTLVTTDVETSARHGALSAIDILVVNLVALEPGGGYPMQDLNLYLGWLSGNPVRRFWSYQGCSVAGTCTNSFPGPRYPPFPATYPNYHIDGTPVANRVMEWLTYMHGQSGELYYYIDICDGPGGESNLCGYPFAGSATNPLVSDYYSGGWGDGTLMYPGSSAYAGTLIPIWLPSIRLKHIRDGMQDYEYLHALTKLGLADFAAAQVASFITNSYTFNNDPRGLNAARIALGTKLHGFGPTGPPVPVSPPVISAVTAAPASGASVIVSWVTDTDSDTQVNYGLTPAYGQSSPLQTLPVTKHSASLSSLSPATLYHYRVASRDSSGNLSVSSDYTFTTGAAAPPAPGIGITLVQHQSAHALSAAFPATVTAGNLIAVSFSGDQGNFPISSISDTQANTYTRALSCGGAGVNGEIWYARNVQGGPVTITIHAAGGGNAGIAEFQGVDPADPLDATQCNTSPFGHVYDTGTLTTGYDSELLYAAIVDSTGLPVAGAGYTLLDARVFNVEFGHEYRIAGPAGSYNATFSDESGGALKIGAVMVAALKPAGAITGGPGRIAVPNTVGLTQAAAQAALTVAGLTTGAVTAGASSTVPIGNVVSTNPLAGTLVSSGSGVSLVVSTGAAAAGDISLFANTYVNLGQSAALPVSLSTPAPDGGVVVTLTSSDPTKVAVTPTVFIPAGRLGPNLQPVLTGLDLGTVAITATAANYKSQIQHSQVIALLSFARSSVTMAALTSQVVMLNLSGPAPAGGLTVSLSSDDTGVVTVPANVTFAAGSSSVAVPVTSLSSGQTVIHAGGSAFLSGTSLSVLAGAF